MRKLARFIVALLCAQSAWSASWPYQPQALRWTENYSALCKQDTLNLWAFKCIPLGQSTDDFMSLGAEYRWRVDDYDPLNFGLNNGSDLSSVQQRALAHADLHFGEALRFFTQFGGGTERGRTVQRPGDEDQADVVQAFADVALTSGASAWKFRLGRQELAIGRYVAIRDSTNVRRTFDGVRIDGTFGSNSLLAAAAQSTRIRDGAFNNDSNPNDRFAAIMLSHALHDASDFKLDLALLDHDNKQAIYSRGVGHEDRRSVGLRFSGMHGPWDIDTQASFQFGDFSTSVQRYDISAWGAAFEGGVSAKQFPTQPRLGVRIDIAGGDRDASDHSLNTFDLPYPNLSYLTDAAFFAPRNVWDIQPFVSFNLPQHVTATLGAQFLWRLSKHDAIYNSANIPQFAASTAENFIATQPYLRLSWRPVPIVIVQLSLEKAFVGDVVTHAGGRDESYKMFSITVEI